MYRPSLLVVIFTTLITSLSLSRVAFALEITTSIKPLQLLVASISTGISQPHLLIPGASSPHDFQLRPSERRQLEQADLIFWVGPALEMSLTKVLQQLPASTRVIALADPTSPPAQQPGPHSDAQHSPAEHGHAQHSPSEHSPSKHSHAQHSHEGQGADPHIWLDPERAALLAERIADILIEVDPAHQADYQHNLQQFLTRLRLHDQQLRTRLEPLRQRGYFVFHDAYQGFEQHYQLNHLGAFTLSPERRPGARHLAEIRQQLLDQAVVCVFSEPQFPPSLVSRLLEGTQVRQGQLDPLGVEIEADADGYLRLLSQLGDAFEACLSTPE